jgi:hypothetical protein
VVGIGEAVVLVEKVVFVANSGVLVINYQYNQIQPVQPIQLNQPLTQSTN